MGADLLARLGLALVLILVGVGLYWAWNKLQLRRLGRRRGAQQALRGLEDLRPGAAGILYFTTPDCLVCLTAQRPALQRLEAQLGDDLQVIEVDASVQTDLADYWGVLSVPTTFIIGTDGRPASMNHGLTSKEKLLHQVRAAQQHAPALPAIGDQEQAVWEKIR
ncbi:MAG: thioredoxin family protein [Anaerolineales bacterium]